MTPYSSEFYDSQAAGSLVTARVILRELTSVSPIKSIVDVGCGVGPWLKAASELGVARTIGLDGDYVDRGRLLKELSQFISCDLEKENLNQAVGNESFELVMCLEVAEHLPAERAQTFIEQLCGLSNLVLFSAAIPGQGGTNHINEQWPDYWSLLFENQRFACFDVLHPRIWHREECEWWYLQNILLFARRGTRAFELASHLGAPVSERPMGLVHPRMLRHFGWAAPTREKKADDPGEV
jgi:SAM-dependent methyltransferase